MVNNEQALIIRDLGVEDYSKTWQAMTAFTNTRDADTLDELWLVQHSPVFTLGQAGKKEHIILPKDIPVVQCDRGGQVTYHGPGQLIAYSLLDLKRAKIGVRELVEKIEEVLIQTLSEYQIRAERQDGAPGVYVSDEKIAALGLRVRKGCSFHGMSMNVAMDLEPFTRINPCGYPGLGVVQMIDKAPKNLNIDVDQVAATLVEKFCEVLSFKKIFPPNT
ncbi:lipoyl(octanoyl) transferase LipB [Aurantivibrio infirmus]